MKGELITALAAFVFVLLLMRAPDILPVIEEAQTWLEGIKQ